ncbi:hypothetical protein M501DRAFT_986032 [Patellaria atrata CBS 101060]|uniref:Uncharacterized protein n=1 Tax=Patellaria atrata CBS 101060 TaxID=1346257 RepID=A0A9P4S8F7_9PEZI|nr:hypothetical protein M501DRAFT_986032 [Patellaria atrata CBS 101060]
MQGVQVGKQAMERCKTMQVFVVEFVDAPRRWIGYLCKAAFRPLNLPFGTSKLVQVLSAGYKVQQRSQQKGVIRVIHRSKQPSNKRDIKQKGPRYCAPVTPPAFNPSHHTVRTESVSIMPAGAHAFRKQPPPVSVPARLTTSAEQKDPSPATISPPTKLIIKSPKHTLHTVITIPLWNMIEVRGSMLQHT